MSDEWIQEELDEKRRALAEADQAVIALETEWRDAERNVANASDSDVKREQRVYDSVMADLRNAQREQASAERGLATFEAWASPLGQLARSAYRAVDYDYDEEECYPGVVEALEARLTELGLKLVEA